MSVLILGIGNTLLSDDGVGVHAIHYLNAQYPSQPQVSYLDGGTLSFSLAGPIADASALIIIDAAELDQHAGTIRMFEGEEMDSFLGKKRKGSVHEVGLLELLATSEMLEELPRNRALIGIQPESLEWGERPTEVVGSAIPKACDMALELAARWQV